jgi:heme exporter protein D
MPPKWLMIVVGVWLAFGITLTVIIKLTLH